MKLWKRTFVMLAAFAAVTLLAVLAAVIPSTGGGPAFELPKVTKDAVTKIQFLNIAAPFTLEKSGGAWTIMPGGHKVADKKMDSALDALAALNVGTLVSNSSDQLATYDVADEGFTLAVSTDKGEAWRLIIGKESADRRGSYVRVPGDKRVFLSLSHLKATVPNDSKAWRDRQITKFEKDQAVKFAVESGGAALSFAKEEGKDWAFEKKPDNLPEDFRLDPTKIEKAVTTLANMNATDFKDDAGDLAQFGLKPPAAAATVTLKDGSPVTILYGREDDKKYYLQKSGDPQVYLVSSYQKDQVATALEGFRDLHPAPFKFEDAAKVEIAKGKDKLVFDKTDKWALTDTTEDKPAGFVLDPVKVDNIVRGASRLEAKSLVGKAAPAAAGLAAPQGALKVTLRDGSVKLIRFGAETGDKEQYLAGDGGLVYLAAQGTGTRILKGINDFKVTAAQSQAAPNMMSPDMLSKLPGVRDQLMQQQKQKIMQNQMLKQLMKKGGQDAPPPKP